MTTSSPLRVGLIGCGNISNAYFKGIEPFAHLVQITACSDLDRTVAQAKADAHGVAKVCSPSELLKDPDIDIILNLTVPKAHAEVNLAALKAGRHVYCEKPFSLTKKEGARVLDEAKKRKRWVGCAPDTVLGGGIQTCRKVIDDGVIGKPVAAVANMLCHGHESWHPSPEFYYEVGGGPLFDMGPYYLASLITFFGPAKNVVASAKISFKTRTITSQPRHGKVVKVETPTHLSGLIEFANGAVATVTMSFDVWGHHLPLLEIYGSEGSLQCPDPNTFGGEVRVKTRQAADWSSVPLTHSDKTGRGFGLADMAHAIQNRHLNRLNGSLALHIVEIMEAFHTSARTGRRVPLKLGCKQPEALPAGLLLGQIARNESR